MRQLVVYGCWCTIFNHGMCASFDRLTLDYLLGRMRLAADGEKILTPPFCGLVLPLCGQAACSCLCAVRSSFWSRKTQTQSFILLYCGSGFFCSLRVRCLVLCLHALFIAFGRVHDGRFRFACDHLATACCMLCNAVCPGAR